MTLRHCPRCGRSASEFDLHCGGCGASLAAAADEPTAILAQAVPSPPDPAADPRLNQVVSRFRILSRLGSGGMGVVYRAVDLELGREVALKFMIPRGHGNPREEARFLREARLAASLDHPNIATLHEIGSHEGQPFLAMALYEGETLRQRLNRMPQGTGMPIAEVLPLARDLAAALAAAHAAGVAHRDLKPSNVFLTRDGRVKLLDFGLARHSEDSALTEAGVAAGTAAYMAPERLRGEPSGAPSDLWSLGVLLWEMLAGRHPFGGERQGMMHAILYEKPPSLRDVRPDLPRELEHVIDGCLRREPEDRYPTGHVLLAELLALDPITGTSPGVLPERFPARRRRRLLAGLAALVLALVAGTVWLRSRRTAPPLSVAVARAEISGIDDAAGRARLAAVLESSAGRTLAAFEGITVLDPSQVRPIAGGPTTLARAVAAQEVVTLRAECTEALCTVTFRRLGGERGDLLASEPAQIPREGWVTTNEVVTTALGRAFPERRLLRPLPRLRARDSDYRLYLDLLNDATTARRPAAEILADCAALRTRAPGFLDAYLLEGSLLRFLFSQSHDPVLLERGLEVVQRAREMAPDDTRPAAVLFDLHLEAGQLVAARKALDLFAANTLNSPEVLLRRARLADRSGQPRRAAELLAELVRQQPSWQYLLTLANLEYRMGRLEASRGHLLELLRRAPDNTLGRQTLAQIELVSGEPEAAVELLQRLAVEAPSLGTLTNLGTALLLLRRPAEAEPPLRHAVALAPADPQSQLTLADCLALSGRPAEARTLYLRVVQLTEGSGSTVPPPLLGVRAQALAHLGENVDAVGTVRTAQRLAPDSADRAFDAALVFALVGDRTSAGLAAEEALRLGLSPAWFRFSWFDPLRGSPPFSRLAGGAAE